MKRLLRPGRSIALLTCATAVVVLIVFGGAMFSPGALNRENKTGAKAGGVSSHAELSGNCAACHAPPWSGETMANRCLACHTDVRKQIDTGAPMHGKLAAARNCRECHTEHLGPHGVLTSFAHFNHDFAAFKLTGKHTTLDCAACHKDNHFKGTAQSCVACHVEPKVHLGRFGVNCTSCHSTTTWKGALVTLSPTTFDHDTTGFKLTGKHKAADCKACHTSGVFKGTSQSCVSCHAEPVVHKDRFGVACASCHTTATWKGAIVHLAAGTFDHNTTNFKLTGKHAAVACASCHKDNHFKGTAQSCVSCHAEPKSPEVHKARYGVNCVTCHTTLSWKDTNFKHTFPINHHSKGGKGPKGVGNTCATCHNDPTNFTAYTCYNCHAHQPARIERIHANRKMTFKLQECAKCHKTGRQRGAIDGPERDEFLVWLSGAEDVERVHGERGHGGAVPSEVRFLFDFESIPSLTSAPTPACCRRE